MRNARTGPVRRQGGGPDFFLDTLAAPYSGQAGRLAALRALVVAAARQGASFAKARRGDEDPDPERPRRLSRSAATPAEGCTAHHLAPPAGPGAIRFFRRIISLSRRASASGLAARWRRGPELPARAALGWRISLLTPRRSCAGRLVRSPHGRVSTISARRGAAGNRTGLEWARAAVRSAGKSRGGTMEGRCAS